MTDELLQLEKGFWNAAGDGSFYRDHMASDGLCVFPVGVLDRDATIEAVTEAHPWDTVEMTDVTTLDLGDDEAALCYRAEARRDNSRDYVAFISSVYTRVAGDWKLNLHQQTPVEDG